MNAAGEPPYFEDLEVGQVVAASPALTLSAGHAALHQAILGDRVRLALDGELSREVVGAGAPLAHPGLVCDVAIGQSTLLTQRVIGNLFYRGLALRRAPLIGDTLRTSTEVVALRQNRPRPERPATGLAVLRVRTVDQEGRPVLDFRRCAMLPLRDPEGKTGRADESRRRPPRPTRGRLRPRSRAGASTPTARRCRDRTSPISPRGPAGRSRAATWSAARRSWRG